MYCDRAMTPSSPQPTPAGVADSLHAAPLTGLPLIVAGIRTLVTYVVISLYVVVLGPLGLLLAMLFRSPTVLFLVSRGGVRLGFALVGIRCRVHGLEHVPRDRPVVFCANHVSNVDPPALFVVLHPRLRMLYKAEFEKLPILGRAVRIGGFIRVERGNPEQGQWAVEQAVAALKAGRTVLVYPEGTRSRTGELLPFKKGGFVMAIKAQVPVVPVAIDGARAAMKKGSRVIRPVTVEVRVGTPIETTGMTLEDRDRLAGLAREQIQQMLSVTRGQA